MDKPLPEPTYDELLTRLTPLIREALQTDGAHHKQWYLWRIAEALGIVDFAGIDADEGIAP